MLVYPSSMSKSLASFRHERRFLFLQLYDVLQNQRERWPVMINIIRVLIMVVLSLPMLSVLAVPPKRTDKGYIDAISKGADTVIVLSIVDDGGVPVDGAEIKAIFSFRGGFRHVQCETGADGNASIHGKTTGDEIVFTISKHGYYDSRMTSYLRFGENRPVEDGKWQPWGESRKVILKKVKNPVALRQSDLSLMVPDTNAWFEVDLECGDWVKPHGKGAVADCEVRVTWDGGSPYRCKFCKTDIRFTEPFSGAYDVKNVEESDMPFPYEAQTNAVYRQIFEYYDRKDGQKLRESLRPNFSRVARVRCIVSENGELLKANYCGLRCIEASPGDGKAILGLTSVFNPTPNDTNEP